MLPPFSLHAGFNFEQGVPWSKVSDTREKGACVATCCMGLKVQILSPLSLIVTEFFRIPSQSNALSSAPSPSLPFSLELTTEEHVSSHYQVGDNETRDGGDRPPHALSQSNLDSRITMKVYMVWRGNQSGNITQSAFCSGFQLCNSSRWQGRQIGRVYGREPHSSSSKNITMNADWQPRCAPITSLCLPLPPLSPPKF